MSVQIVNYRNVREGIYTYLEGVLSEDREKLALAVRYIVQLVNLTVDLNGPGGFGPEVKAARRQAKAHAWGALLKGMGANVDIPDEASLNAITLAVEAHLIPHLKGYEVYGEMIKELPTWVALGATPFAPDTDGVTN